MNTNRIQTYGFSNPESERLYRTNWADESAMQKQKNDDCLQCGGCAFFAAFNADYGLCCHATSRHYLETVFEHFTCPAYVDEGWGPHSFSANPELHCRCHGDPPEEWEKLIRILEEVDAERQAKRGGK